MKRVHVCLSHVHTHAHAHSLRVLSLLLRYDLQHSVGEHLKVGELVIDLCRHTHIPFTLEMIEVSKFEKI